MTIKRKTDRFSDRILKGLAYSGAFLIYDHNTIFRFQFFFVSISTFSIGKKKLSSTVIFRNTFGSHPSLLRTKSLEIPFEFNDRMQLLTLLNSGGHRGFIFIKFLQLSLTERMIQESLKFTLITSCAKVGK